MASSSKGPGQGAQQSRAGRRRQVKRTKTAGKAASLSASKQAKPKGGEPYQAATARQLRTFKQERRPGKGQGASGKVAVDIIPKVGLAVSRAVQNRQLASSRARANIVSADASLVAPKVTVRRSCQKGQTGALKTAQRSAT